MRPPVGAGLYSFFSNYSTACLGTSSCQSQVFNIDLDSSVSVYGLATVGTTSMLSIDGRPIIPASPNVNGFQHTVTAWSRSKHH